MKNRKLKLIVLIVLIVIAVLLLIALWPRGPRPGTVLDEARQANRPASSFLAADQDYFHDMDGGVALSLDEVKGRNAWTGGNDRLWDKLTVASFGALDLLKTLSSYPNPVSSDPNHKLKYSRDN